MSITDSGRVDVVTNELIEAALTQADMAEEAPVEEPTITPPPDTVFDLPGGFISPTGEVAMEAEVRELTGRDEEVIAKATTIQKALSIVLQRGLVRVGSVNNITDGVLNNMLAGDRDYALLRIYAATFGKDVKTTQTCTQCGSEVDIEIDVLADIPVKRLESPTDRRIFVECSVGKVAIDLPTGYTQKEIMAHGDKTLAELTTILLENTVVQINDRPVVGRNVVLDLPIRDRRKINEALADHQMGPQMQDIKVECPNCATEMEVPLSLAALFQF
jgi:hypothetical protein